MRLKGGILKELAVKVFMYILYIHTVTPGV
jgi:hypothetical protein